ncbi:MAG: DegT/DnrJ/EryC1/StrS family aminotransferase [Planctomycetota bacterium]
MPLADQSARLRPELMEAIGRVVDSGRYILGPEVEAFEKEFPATTQGPPGLACASGTDALALALRALGMGPGDEVLMPAMTAFPTAAAVRQIGASPKLVDIRSQTRCMDPALVESSITPNTRALIFVHLYGYPTHDALKIQQACARAGVKLLEDCAQCTAGSIGQRRIGTLGQAAAFSFYPTKNLGALGDGGFVASTDITLLQRVRRLRMYGFVYGISEEWGINSRMDDMQAAVLRAKLAHLAEWNRKRLRLHERYLEGLSGIAGLALPRLEENVLASPHLFVVEAEDRDVLQQHLAAKGIETLIHYPRAIHQHPSWTGGGSHPVAERLASHCLSLPFHQDLRDDQVDEVAEAVRELFA